MTKAGQGATPERELKFIANRKTFKTALTLPLLGEATEGGAGRRLKSVYFDTDAGDLIRHGLTLRVRRTKGVYVMGLKTAAESDQGIFERGESEVKLPSAEPDLTLFDEAVAREIRKIAGGKTLAPKFGSNIRRSTRTVEIAGTAIEIALDSG
jgi:triphosphatase